MFSSEATKAQVGPKQGETNMEVIAPFHESLDPNKMGFDGSEGDDDDAPEH